MTNEASVRFGRKYKPLFVKARTRYKIIYGGRASAKSFAVASALLLRTYEDDYNILFTRWTMDSAKDSVIPEFKDKMERMGVEGHFTEWKTSVQNRSTGGKVLFRGLKQGSKNQVAKMKSLFGIKIWVLDEAQELIDETTFDTIDNSIRDANTTNEVWLVLNPTDIGHWIYRRFFIEAGVPDGFSGVKDNVEYIYTTYLDNLKNLDEGFIAKAEKLKEINPEKYGNIYLGNWLVRKAGIIYPRWEQITPEEYPHHLDQWYGNDWAHTHVLRCGDADYLPVGGMLHAAHSFRRVQGNQGRCGDDRLRTGELPRILRPCKTGQHNRVTQARSIGSQGGQSRQGRAYLLPQGIQGEVRGRNYPQRGTFLLLATTPAGSGKIHGQAAGRERPLHGCGQLRSSHASAKARHTE